MSKTIYERGEKLAFLIKNRGMAKYLRDAYDDAQGAAENYDEYMDLLNAGKQEEADNFAHDHAIERLWEILVDNGHILDTTPQSVVDVAFTEL